MNIYAVHPTHRIILAETNTLQPQRLFHPYTYFNPSLIRKVHGSKPVGLA